MNEIITQKEIEKTITIKNGKEVVRSDKLAKVFDRTHKQVLALIRENLSFFKENNLSLKDFFIEEITTTSKGKSYTRYYLTRKGFDLIALSLKGKKAKLYKLWFIESFHEKSELIKKHKLTAELNHKDFDWTLYRQATKEARLNLTEAIREYIVKYREEIEKKMNDGRYYENFTKLIYKKLKIDLPKGANPRDVLDKKTLARLTAIEYDVADLIKKYAEAGMHYKLIYQQIKKDLGV